jgi:chromosome segregation ATPase
MDQLKQETRSHLQYKADLTVKLSSLNKKVKKSMIKLNELKKRSTGENIIEKTEIEITQLTKSKRLLEDEITTIKSEIPILETRLAQISTDMTIFDTKIEVLSQEKQEQEKNIEIKKKTRKNDNRTEIILKNEKEKLEKLKIQIERQKSVKKNLLSFLGAFSIINQVISNLSPLNDSKKPLSSDIAKSMQDKIIQAKKSFDKAKTSFQPNNLEPFLVDADEAYQTIISVIIQLCENIKDSLLERDFNEQVFTLMDMGLPLNTKQLNAVTSILSKLEKGVEIAPLASFSNEIMQYYIENLTLLRITG